MPDNTIQASFNSGEWSPYLYSRVDMQKYRSGAALLRNFFVDYRGGATTRGGTQFINGCYRNDGSSKRLIPFQVSTDVGFILEFGVNYIRPYLNGAPQLESVKAVTNATNANPGVLTVGAHGYTTGDTVFCTGFVGGTWGTNLNGNYYGIIVLSANTFTLFDLFSIGVDTTGFGAFAGGSVQRVFTITNSPYVSTEVTQLKYTQNVNTLILCHPNHPPYELVFTAPNSWVLQAITFGSTISAPGGTAIASSGLAAGTVNYAYVVTAVDDGGQESAPSTPITAANLQDIRTTPASITLSWASVTGAQSYNAYRAELRYGSPVPTGAAYGYIGNTTGTNFTDSNIVPDFSVGYPIVQNPFSGTGVQNLTLTNNGAGYQAVPIVTLTASPGTTATAVAVLGVYSATVISGGTRYTVNDILGTFTGTGVLVAVAAVTGLGTITAVNIYATGSISGAGTSAPTGTETCTNISVANSLASGATIQLAWRVISLNLTSPGTGYLLTPSVTFTGGSPSVAATATATLGAPSAGNPTVPGFFQQRLILAGPVSSPQQLNASQPGAPYNFNITLPTLPTDAFTGTLVSGVLNTIQSMVSQPQGLIIFSDRQAWLVNGGSPGSGIDATNTVANAHIFNGAGFPPPIVAVDNILYVQAKNSIVRDLIFDFSKQVYTGRDISVLASHLFYGFQINEWAFAEEPFKLIWVVRSDGQLLCLTFLKEQELCAWTHCDTQGQFNSVATVVEDTNIGEVDATYFIVSRLVRGQNLQYIERMSELYYPSGVEDAINVDSSLSYSGTATVNFSGAQHLGGLTVTGLADGVIIPEFTMPTSGSFTLSSAASKVVIGLSYVSQLQTLPLELGDPTVQGKVKKINSVDVRVANALGLEIGQDFDNLVPMRDLVRGNVSSMLTGQSTSQLVTDLVSGDAREFLSPAYTVPGQYCIQQDNPYPATILGVIPNITLGEPGSRA